MLQRGTISTRWRDLLDVAVLSDRFEFDAADVREAAIQVARHRTVELGPLRALMDGYGATGQAKWAAWRRKLKVEDLCEQNLNAQIERVLTFIEPVFDGSHTGPPPVEPCAVVFDAGFPLTVGDSGCGTSLRRSCNSRFRTSISRRESVLVGSDPTGSCFCENVMNVPAALGPASRRNANNGLEALHL